MSREMMIMLVVYVCFVWHGTAAGLRANGMWAYYKMPFMETQTTWYSVTTPFGLTAAQTIPTSSVAGYVTTFGTSSGTAITGVLMFLPSSVNALAYVIAGAAKGANLSTFSYSVGTGASFTAVGAASSLNAWLSALPHSRIFPATEKYPHGLQSTGNGFYFHAALPSSGLAFFISTIVIGTAPSQGYLTAGTTAACLSAALVNDEVGNTFVVVYCGLGSWWRIADAGPSLNFTACSNCSAYASLLVRTPIYSAHLAVYNLTDHSVPWPRTCPVGFSNNNMDGTSCSTSACFPSSGTSWGWSAKINGKYITNQHGSTVECYTTLAVAQQQCVAAGDCGGVTTQNNICSGGFRVTHGPVVLADDAVTAGLGYYSYTPLPFPFTELCTGGFLCHNLRCLPPCASNIAEPCFGYPDGTSTIQCFLTEQPRINCTLTLLNNGLPALVHQNFLMVTPSGDGSISFFQRVNDPLRTTTTEGQYFDHQYRFMYLPDFSKVWGNIFINYFHNGVGMAAPVMIKLNVTIYDDSSLMDCNGTAIGMNRVVQNDEIECVSQFLVNGKPPVWPMLHAGIFTFSIFPLPVPVFHLYASPLVRTLQQCGSVLILSAQCMRVSEQVGSLARARMRMRVCCARYTVLS